MNNISQENLELIELGHMIRERLWEDLCNHSEDHYVGSFIHVPNTRTKLYCDLYVYPDNNHEDCCVCIRTGSDQSDYIGYPSLPMFMRAASNSDLYNKAIRCMLLVGSVMYKKKEKLQDSYDLWV